jgi:hypothetical protein
MLRTGNEAIAQAQALEGSPVTRRGESYDEFLIGRTTAYTTIETTRVRIQGLCDFDRSPSARTTGGGGRPVAM